MKFTILALIGASNIVNGLPASADLGDCVTAGGAGSDCTGTTGAGNGLADAAKVKTGIKVECPTVMRS